jgi:hypothetical protein
LIPSGRANKINGLAPGWGAPSVPLMSGCGMHALSIDAAIV